MMMMMMIINWLTISLFSLLFTVSCLSAKSIFTRQEMDLVPKYNTSHLKLFRPSLSSFAPKLEEKLKALFEHVTVSVVDCPDLSRKPFNLAGKAIGGRTAIADIGGVGLLMPLPKKPYPTYSLVKISQEMGFHEAHVMGASCSPFVVTNNIGEYMPNLLMTKNEHTNKTLVHHGSWFAKMNCDKLSYTTRRFDSDLINMLGNVFVSENKTGPIIKVHAKRRIHDDGKSITEAIAKILSQLFPEQAVSMGGVFLIKSGSINVHVMPCEFGAEPLDTIDKINNWLNFFDAQAPIVCQTVFHSKDNNLDLRIEHSHCFSDHDQGGHYHYDTSPDTIEYEMYLNFADDLYRVDQAKN